MATKSAKKKPKKERLTRGKLIGKIDRLVSIYVRYGSAVKRNGKFYCTCVSCGKEFPIEKIDCGHFVQRGCLPLRFDMADVAPECLTGEAPLMLSNRKKILQKDVKVGDMIIGHDDGHEIITRVDYVEKVKSPIIRIELKDGRSFRGSPNHKVLTTKGYMKLSDIEKCIALGGACDIITI